MVKSDAIQSPIDGRYHLIREIGRGGMGKVYLAVVLGPAAFSKLVVVKILREDRDEDSNATMEMFLDEARLAARMQHPNVVQTIDLGSVGGQVFLVMEYLDGQPLNRLIRKARDRPESWSLDRHLTVLNDALAGLHYAHELRDYDGTPLGFVHRDMSPQNVFITFAGQIKIIDFGIAKSAASQHRTHLGLLRGKMAYLAPEYARGEPLTRAADIFAAGVMLYEALCGERMWHGRTETEIFRSLLAGEIPDVHEKAPKSPQRLREACARALAVQPSARFATAGDLQHEIRGWLLETRMHVTPQEIGWLASSLFPKERQDVARDIDDYMRALPGQTRIAKTDRPTDPPAPFSAPPISVNPGEGAHLLDCDTSAQLRSGAFGDVLFPWRRRIRGMGPWLAGSGGLLLLIGLLLASRTWVRGRDPSERVDTPENAAASPPPGATQSVGSALPPRLVATDETRVPEPKAAIVLRATPPDAVWTLDGAVLRGNPLVVPLDRSARPHLLRATAPGCIPVEREVVADHDVLVEVRLRPAHPRPQPLRSGSAESTPGPQSAASTTPHDTGWAPPAEVRALDNSDPFTREPSRRSPPRPSQVRTLDNSDPFGAAPHGTNRGEHEP